MTGKLGRWRRRRHLGNRQSVTKEASQVLTHFPHTYVARFMVCDL